MDLENRYFAYIYLQRKEYYTKSIHTVMNDYSSLRVHVSLIILSVHYYHILFYTFVDFRSPPKFEILGNMPLLIWVDQTEVSGFYVLIKISHTIGARLLLDSSSHLHTRSQNQSRAYAVFTLIRMGSANPVMIMKRTCIGAKER
jgi:hypothetical protein